jgi:hypothetical protein
MRILVLCIVAAISLGACSLPQPFHPDSIPPLTAPGVRAGLVVAPVKGAVDGALFAEALADALTDQDFAASTKPIAGPSYRLEGHTVSEGEDVRLEWDIEDATRGFAGAITQAIAREDMAAWRAGDPTLYRALANSAAAEIASLLSESNAVAPEPPVIFVPAVAGAPGDGPRTLQRSMAYVLDKRGLKAVEQETPDSAPTFVLKGTMTVTTHSDRSQVAIAWELTRPDGSSIGTVKQANEVPADLLKGAWGDIAFAIADAAGDQVADLVAGASKPVSGSTR